MRVEGQAVYAMRGKNRPGWKVKSGSELTFVTRDCFDNQLLEEDARLEGLDWDAINPATGPVWIEGALPGDVHACMGDGEIMVTGLEIPAEVDVQVEVLKGVSIRNPMLETEEACYTIASDEDLEKAVFSAVYDMTQVVMRQLNMPLEEAGMLLSAMGNLQFCQVVDPKRTVRMEMKRSVLRNMLTS